MADRVSKLKPVFIFIIAFDRVLQGFRRQTAIPTAKPADRQTDRQTDRQRALQAHTEATFRLILLSITTLSLVIPASTVNLNYYARL